MGGEVLLETNSSAENRSPKRGTPGSTADAQAPCLPVQRLPGSPLRLLSVAVCHTQLIPGSLAAGGRPRASLP